MLAQVKQNELPFLDKLQKNPEAKV